MDDCLNWERVMLLDLLHGVSVELETVELEAEDFGQLGNPRRLLRIYFAMVRFVAFDCIVKSVLPRLEEVPLLLILNIQDYVEELVSFSFLLVLGIEQVMEGQEVLRLSLERLLDFRLYRLDQVIWVWS